MLRYQVVYQDVSEHNAPEHEPERGYSGIRSCIRTYQNTIHPNTNQNVDVPVLGSSRYIETQSPVDSNNQSIRSSSPVYLLLHLLLYPVALQSPLTYQQVISPAALTLTNLNQF